MSTSPSARIGVNFDPLSEDMRSFLLNKLVRDKLLTSMQNLGQTVTYRRLTDKDFVLELKRKLLEEAKEFDPSKPGALKELADLLEVIETASNQLGSSFADLRKLQLKLRTKSGAFEDRIFVERLDLANNDPWVAYYAAQPDRFTELTENKQKKGSYER